MEEMKAELSLGLRLTQLAIMIRRQRMELGLGEGGLRHRKNSPTWGVRYPSAALSPFSYSPFSPSRAGQPPARNLSGSRRCRGC
jgi:hypothetical protein